MCKNIIETSSSSATDWHPFGMLDRDQRTIFTFSPIKLAKNDQPLKNFVNKTTKQGQLNKCIACDTMTTTATATDHLCDKKICCTINTNTNDNTKIGTKFIHRNTNTRSHQMHCCHNSNGVGQQRQHQCCRTAAQRQTIKYLRTSKLGSHHRATIPFKCNFKYRKPSSPRKLSHSLFGEMHVEFNVIEIGTNWYWLEWERGTTTQQQASAVINFVVHCVRYMWRRWIEYAIMSIRHAI